jgi:hypothetical protein
MTTPDTRSAVAGNDDRSDTVVRLFGSSVSGAGSPSDVLSL